MITREIAASLKHGTELWHSSAKNADGTPARCRVNGKCKVWKTRPLEFKLPVKHGIRTTFYITEAFAHAWSLPDRWEIERHWRQA